MSKFASHGFTVAAVAVLLQALSTLAVGAEPDNRDVPRGTWTVISTMFDGQITNKYVGQTWMFDVDAITVSSVNDGIICKVPLSVDATTNPKNISWKGEEGDDLNVDVWGIYSLEGGTLKICSFVAMRPHNQIRPTTLETKPGDGRWLLNLRRVGDVQPPADAAK